jgi:hypothetical protein
MDGKTLREIDGEEIPGVHLSAAYSTSAEVVLPSIAVREKEKNEQTGLKPLLETLGSEGRLEGRTSVLRIGLIVLDPDVRAGPGGALGDRSLEIVGGSRRSATRSSFRLPHRIRAERDFERRERNPC